MLDVVHIKKTLFDNKILVDCNFKVKPNTIFGIVGSNGAGKSTLMKICCGVLMPDSGSVFCGTQTIFDNLNAKKNIFFVPDEPFYEFGQTIKSLLKFYHSFYEVDFRYFRELLSKFDLNENDDISKLSKGKKKRAYIVIALAVAPKLLLLDETFDGLDSEAKYIFKNEILNLIKTKEVTVVLTSHALRELSDFVDAIGFLRNGKLITYLDEEMNEDPIYRVLLLDEFNGCSELKILKEVKGEKYLMLDIHNSKEEISTILGSNAYSIDYVPFEDWIVYQMGGKL